MGSWWLCASAASGSVAVGIPGAGRAGLAGLARWLGWPGWRCFVWRPVSQPMSFWTFAQILSSPFWIGSSQTHLAHLRSCAFCICVRTSLTVPLLYCTVLYCTVPITSNTILLLHCTVLYCTSTLVSHNHIPTSRSALFNIVQSSRLSSPQKVTFILSQVDPRVVFQHTLFCNTKLPELEYPEQKSSLLIIHQSSSSLLVCHSEPSSARSIGVERTSHTVPTSTIRRTHIEETHALDTEFE